MEISPIQLFWLTVYSFALGVGVGVLNDVFRVIRLCLGSGGGEKLSRLYSIKLPVVGRALGEHRDSGAKRFAISALTGAQDIFLFCAAAVGTVVLSYYFNNGRIRLHSFVALLLGAVLYYFTVGRIVSAMSDGIAFFIRAGFLIVFALIFRPFATIFTFFRKKCKIFSEKIQKALENQHRKVYNINKVEEILRYSDVGFLISFKKDKNTSKTDD